ncbi:phage antirepressor KilAC domain-containing protein [Bacillus toyonensis]|uniref:phage antirepressor KilAC domain-containing protein n=1 Tax=Bacillus toyonensis TaxID=155322 RepID=UPI0018A143F2|nr:phage antirepressor KilAC domain-containing protein [Bacillus toyonensis]MBF7146768.1 phage antirepressor KilAC domain-containing protein [Bacillus toyonensis]MEC2351215.1 phage antirepressor KilAC domain-containing protein [Bacillus toyonensis]MED3185639.1 phage antirepressor KilAC domain-containing protein [Bacillus toyonensis]
MKNTKIKIELNEEFYPQAKKSTETSKNNVVPFPTVSPIVAAADQVDKIENIDQDALINPENADLRDKYIERVEVLYLVKGLLLLPNMAMATTKQVAELYKVSRYLINKVIERNRDELTSDGLNYQKYSEVAEKVNGHDVNLLSSGVSYRGTYLFPKRAILRIGMLLRDSEVAKEIRSQLLNIEEHATDQQLTKEIDHELDLQAAIGKAIMSGDVLALAQATTKMADYKNRHIAKITEELDEARAEIDEINGKELISMENVGKNYIGDISAMKLNRFLQDRKVLAKDKTDGHYTANLKYAKYFRTSAYLHNGKIRKSLKATREGANFIKDLYKKHAKGGDQNATK